MHAERHACLCDLELCRLDAFARNVFLTASQKGTLSDVRTPGSDIAGAPIGAPSVSEWVRGGTESRTV